MPITKEWTLLTDCVNDRAHMCSLMRRENSRISWPSIFTVCLMIFQVAGEGIFARVWQRLADSIRTN